MLVITGLLVFVIGIDRCFSYIEKYIKRDSYILSTKKKLSVKNDDAIYEWWIKRVKLLIKNAAMVVIVLGMLGIVLELTYKTDKSDKIILDRADYGQDEINYDLNACYEDGSTEEIKVKVSPREYSQNELEAYIDDAFKKGFKIALNENESFDMIQGPLKLVDSIDNNPARLSWELDSDSVFDSNGELLSEITETKLESIRLIVRLQGVEKLQSMDIVIYPEIMTKEEMRSANLVNEISQIDASNKTKKSIAIPKAIKGVRLNKEDEKKNSSYIFLLIIIFIFLLYMKERQDVSNEEKLRKEILISEYPELINKLVLYIGAGNTIKSSFIRISEEEDKSNPLYMELSAMVNEINAGVSEEKCYEKTGKRLKEQCYIRMFNLLLQNLSKGSSFVMTALKNERLKALKAKRDYAKKKGEEASTKLLFPMILLLLVSMIIVMLPALLSFSL
ncbi:MAG: hypothetical protein K5656_08145 [Lachnospiraceae bacterium]|nr:hypothetical protein [Lachnospiraceae bacterium]